MKFVLTLAAILASASQSTTDQPYELKGEAPGMTLKQFKANHRHADCSNPTSHQSLCRVYDDVSFAGQTAATFKHCATLECGAQGLSANFVDGRLVYLMYGVTPGSWKEIIAVLKTKFGEPTEVAHQSATWKNSVGYLTVSDSAIKDANGVLHALGTHIVSALNDTGQRKDI
jgi:hypothetical protein